MTREHHLNPFEEEVIQRIEHARSFSDIRVVIESQLNMNSSVDLERVVSMARQKARDIYREKQIIFRGSLKKVDEKEEARLEQEYTNLLKLIKH